MNLVVPTLAEAEPPAAPVATLSATDRPPFARTVPVVKNQESAPGAVDELPDPTVTVYGALSAFTTTVDAA